MVRFFSLHIGRQAVGPTQVLGAPSPGVKWPRREADRSLSSSAEVKNEWSRRIPSLPHTQSWRILGCRYVTSTGT